jgi:GntR family transcriptional regulator/MocR family aminotransferase
VELLLTVAKNRPGTLSRQIEAQIRAAIRDTSLRPGTPIPSTRELAAELGVSRKVVVDAYGQLAAEGYLEMRQGAQPRVAALTFSPDVAMDPAGTGGKPGYDFRPSRPDVSAFPRLAWSRCLRDAVREITVEDLSYGDAFGVEALRDNLADYLGRVRGVVATRERIVVTNGYLQGLGLICHALKARGARRIAVEDPSSAEEPRIAARAGLVAVPVPVDGGGLTIDALDRASVDAVVLTPAHQHPTGVVLAPERRAALVAWLRAHDAIAIEDDYDAEYRYDRPPVGALQGLDQAHVVYAGTLSKVLAPALRLGWLVLPPSLIEAVRTEKLLADQGTARIEQLALANFLARGDLDRHLRRMRVRYRSRRDAMTAALATHLPEALVRGIAAGLHVTVELPAHRDESAIAAAARARGVIISTLSDYSTTFSGQPTLILGYAQMTESRIHGGIQELAEAVRAS